MNKLLLIALLLTTTSTIACEALDISCNGFTESARRYNSAMEQTYYKSTPVVEEQPSYYQRQLEIDTATRTLQSEREWHQEQSQRYGRSDW